MNAHMPSNDSPNQSQHWLSALSCQDVVLRFMGFFDARAWADMEHLVTQDVMWQRPDRKISGLQNLRDTLHATPDNIRVRHIITNLRPTFTSTGAVVIHSYFTVFRVIGVTPDSNEPAPFDGPVSVGRYRDELVHIEGSWRISSKETHVDFRRT